MFELIIPEDYPIIPELFLILFTTHYSKKLFRHNVRMPKQDYS